MNEDIGNINWYQGYEKCKKLSGTNTNVKTSIIWKTQFDQVLNWLIKTGEKTPLDINIGSLAWGNYNNVEISYYTNTSKAMGVKKIDYDTIIPSGAYEGAKANNIYDIAGNVTLWTLGSLNSGKSDSRIGMGGNSKDFGNTIYAGYVTGNIKYNIDARVRILQCTLHKVKLKPIRL